MIFVKESEKYTPLKILEYNEVFCTNIFENLDIFSELLGRILMCSTMKYFSCLAKEQTLYLVKVSRIDGIRKSSEKTNYRLFSKIHFYLSRSFRYRKWVKNQFDHFLSNNRQKLKHIIPRRFFQENFK